jgi:hypothetical protein
MRGYFVDLETIPPTNEEMGGKNVALILMASLRQNRSLVLS